MAKMNKKSEKPEAHNSAHEISDTAPLSSLEEMILRMRFGLGKEGATDSLERNVSDELRKKLQFLELKAFEQSGRINELLSNIEKKGPRR